MKPILMMSRVVLPCLEKVLLIDKTNYWRPKW